MRACVRALRTIVIVAGGVAVVAGSVTPHTLGARAAGAPRGWIDSSYKSYWPLVYKHYYHLVIVLQTAIELPQVVEGGGLRRRYSTARQ